MFLPSDYCWVSDGGHPVGAFFLIQFNYLSQKTEFIESFKFSAELKFKIVFDPRRAEDWASADVCPTAGGSESLLSSPAVPTDYIYWRTGTRCIGVLTIKKSYIFPKKSAEHQQLNPSLSLVNEAVPWGCERVWEPEPSFLGRDQPRPSTTTTVHHFCSHCWKNFFNWSMRMGLEVITSL